VGHTLLLFVGARYQCQKLGVRGFETFKSYAKRCHLLTFKGLGR